MITCDVCEKEVPRRSSRQRFCSEECSRIVRNKRKQNKRLAEKIPHTHRECLNCGDLFTPGRSDAYCCSRDCTKQRSDKNYYEARKKDPVAYKEYRVKFQEYKNNRRKTDTDYKISELLRSRFKNQMIKAKYNKTPGQFIEVLGCTVGFFREYISRQFEDGMTWDNHAHDTWHIDHIKPIASFNLSNPKQIAECFHYTNHQPLWSSDNQSKGAKIGI